MNIKKMKIAGMVLTVIVLAVPMIGCGIVTYTNQEKEVQTGYTGDEEQTESSDQGDNSSTVKNYSVTFPEQYFIEYDVTSEDGVITTVSEAIDEEGRIYVKNEEEYLFIPEENGYTCYQNKDGKFIRQENERYQLSYIKDLMEEFDDYTKDGVILSADNGNYTGTTDILGRTCDVYEITLDIASNFRQNFKYYIDQETGICMGRTSEKSIAGFEEQEEEFMCTQFETEAVDLIEIFAESI